MKNALNSVQLEAPRSNNFDLTHTHLLTGQMGYLIPCLMMDVVPGDSVRLGCETLVRLAPMLAPIMHRIDIRVEYFFVPNRILWENWEKWISNGGDNPLTDAPLPAHPFVNYSNATSGTTRGYNTSRLFDYFGLPDPDECELPTHVEKIDALPFAAYQKVWQEYYRDENLQLGTNDEYWAIDGDNGGTAELFTLRKRAWEADYFTKALPFAQKGEPVDIPLGEITANARVLAQQDTPPSGDTLKTWTATDLPSSTASAGAVPIGDAANPAITVNQLYAETSGLNVGATTIDDLNLAYKLQRWLQRNAVGGTRYSELIRAHFNVSSLDARLDRPEYIVGVKNPVQISEVLNTTGTEDAAQGTMTGHGIAYEKGNYAKYFCHEFGWIVGVMSIMPKPSYQQGIHKSFLKINHPTEKLWPVFGHLGEQEIQNKELMAFRDNDAGEETFGYTPRYMEYKTMPNRVCGQFKSSLDFWTMTRIFDPAGPPALNAQFVEADPTQRIFAVTDPNVDQCYVQVLHKITALRALPFYGTPSLLI